MAIEDSKIAGRTVFLSGQGTSGDINPLIGIATELSARGAVPILVLNDHYRELVEGLGFSFRSTGSASSHRDFVRDPRTWDPRQDIGAFSWERISKVAITEGFRHVREWLEGNKALPIIIGIQPTINGTIWAGEAYNLPIVNIALAPNLLISENMPPAPAKWSIPNWLPAAQKRQLISKLIAAENARLFRKPYYLEMQSIRAQYGLKPLGGISISSLFPIEFKNIAFWPRKYASPAEDWPKALEFVGFPLFDPKSEGIRKEVDQFIADYGAPVLVTFGTGVQNTDELFRQVLEAQSSFKVPLLFVGGGGLPKKVAASAKVIHADYLDFASVFPRCRLIIHHGGIGTTAQAIKARIPQLIRPMAYDQFDNADRVRTLNFGDFLIEQDFKPERIANKIRALILSEKVSDALRTSDGDLTSNKSIDLFCNIVEKSLVDIAPSLSRN